MAPELPGVFAWLVPIPDSYGYLAVFGFLFIESFGAPVPGQTMLMAAGVFAGAGRLNVVGIAVLGFLAAVAGDNVGYLIGRFGGRRLALRFGRYIFVTEKRLAKAEDFFARHGGKIVGVARFIEVDTIAGVDELTSVDSLFGEFLSTHDIDLVSLALAADSTALIIVAEDRWAELEPKAIEIIEHLFGFYGDDAGWDPDALRALGFEPLPIPEPAG